MKLYVAGPMTGQINYNFPAFAEATARLRAQGHDVVSPAEHDVDEDYVNIKYDAFGGMLSVETTSKFQWQLALDWDLNAISECNGVYFLPGWSKSRGAITEYQHAARLDLHLFGALDETPETEIKQQPLVGLVGYAQAGKDTFAGYLGYHRLAFADALKALAYDVSQELRTHVLYRGWEYAKQQLGMRELLQDLGVGVREHIDPEAWVKAAFLKYDPTLPTVITDVRFPNEIDAIRRRGGIIVRIDRAGHQPVNGHVSEFAWQATEPDEQYTFADGGLYHMELVAHSLRDRL